MVHLIITEKNIAAQRIAQILSGSRRVSQEKEGGVNTYSFDGTIVIGLRGHVVEVDFEPGYTNWRSKVYTPRSLIDAGTIKKPTEKKIVSQLRKRAKNADIITIATDFDTEGELIGKEAYELVREVNRDVPIQRVRFSAITPQEIHSAFANPTNLDFNLAAAGEARQVIDLMWGASLTRFISIAARRGGKNILSVGRVQSPTLAMIVDREQEIDAFESQKYWLVSVDAEKSGEVFLARHAHGRFWDYSEATDARDRTKEPLTVIKATEGSKVDRPPAPFNTTTFIVAAARLGFSAANAMRIAENLYMNGHISYPRTDNTIYPPSLDLGSVLTILESSRFSEDVRWVRANLRSAPTRGKKSSTDHPPIHPTGAARRDELPDDHGKIYELVVRRFLATLSPDARWKTMKYAFEASGEPYTATGSHLEEEGYLHVYLYSDARELYLPALEVGEKLPIRAVNCEEKETNPPPRYSQSRLIQQMEELGLGTKSTRHEVIGKLYTRRYVEGTPIRPTLVGMAVTGSLECHAELITKPDMTQTLEKHMEEIKSGKRVKEDVISESREMLHLVFDKLEEHEGVIGDEIMDRTDEEQVIGKCPVCHHNLMIRHARGMKQFIGCTNYPACTFNIGLPGAQWGRAVRTNVICRTHGLHGVLLVRKGARPWDLSCPLCMHIQSNIGSFSMMPSLTDDMVARLHDHHVYTVYEVANTVPGTLERILGVGGKTAEQVRDEAESVLDILRKRSELRKFLRSQLRPRRGRSQAKILEALYAVGVNEIRDLAALKPAALKPMKISETEAESLIMASRNIVNETRLRDLGLPAASLKKYHEAGIMTPEDICYLHPAYLSSKTGISLETVQKHGALICAGLGVQPPKIVTRKMVEKGRSELLTIPGIGEATLEKLYRAGVINAGSLLAADPVELAKTSGISEKNIRSMIAALRT